MMDMHDRIMRVLDTTHVVRIEDSTVYKVLDIVPLGDDVLFVVAWVFVFLFILFVYFF